MKRQLKLARPQVKHNYVKYDGAIWRIANTNKHNEVNNNTNSEFHSNEVGRYCINKT